LLIDYDSLKPLFDFSINQINKGLSDFNSQFQIFGKDFEIFIELLPSANIF